MKLLMILTCVILTLAALTQADFTDDFDGALSPLWDPVLGVWELKDGAYNARAVGRLPAFSLLPFEAADGLVIEVRGMDTAKGQQKNFYVVFAYVDESEIYFVGSAIKRGLWYIGRMSEKGWDDRAGDFSQTRRMLIVK